MQYSLKLFLLSMIFSVSMLCPSFVVTWKDVIHDTESGTVTVNCSYKTNGNYVMAESMQAVSFPLRQYVSIMFEQQPHELYVPNMSNPILVLFGEGDLTFIIPSPDAPVEKISLFYSLYDTKLRRESEPLTLDVFSSSYNPPFVENITITNSHENKHNEEMSLNLGEHTSQNCEDQFCEEISSCDAKHEKTITERLISYLSSENNSAILLGILFIVGILMSFTPCMYPMIPITLGILGVSKDRTNRSIVFRATAYIAGMAVTFSILGLIAAYGGMIFGGLLANKYFILLLTCGLLYMTGGMLDVYEITLPHVSYFNYQATSSSLIGPFMYGMFSGTISSPCVSPGLVALLTLVSQKGDMIIGALYLFIFGLGMGFPLWITAIFFKKYEAMPRSGMWMISIKKIIGISMLFISLKYLILLIPDLYAYMILGSITLILLYKEVNKIEIKKIFLSSWHEYMLLFLMIFSCGFMFFSAYNIFYKNKKNNEYKIHFIHSFDMAVSCAKSQNKYVLVDFTADWCSLCKSLENKHFNNIIFWNMLDPRIVAVKIDCTSWEDPETQKYLEQYNIKGLPTILVINPETKETVLQFDSKIITWTTEEVAQKIIDACVG